MSVADREREVLRLTALQDQEPGRYTADLAWALVRFAEAIIRSGRVDDGLDVMLAAVRLLRDRVDAGVAGDQEACDLPLHLDGYAALLADARQVEHALEASDEAITRHNAAIDAGVEPIAAESFVAGRLREHRDSIFGMLT